MRFISVVTCAGLIALFIWILTLPFAAAGFLNMLIGIHDSGSGSGLTTGLIFLVTIVCIYLCFVINRALSVIVASRGASNSFEYLELVFVAGAFDFSAYILGGTLSMVFNGVSRASGGNSNVFERPKPLTQMTLIPIAVKRELHGYKEAMEYALDRVRHRDLDDSPHRRINAALIAILTAALILIFASYTDSNLRPRLELWVQAAVFLRLLAAQYNVWWISRRI